MKTTFLRQTTSDKLILQGLLYEPKEKSKKLILHIHGMSGNFYENGYLDFMTKTFTDSGFAFLTINTRGHDYIAYLQVESKKEEFKKIGNTFEKFEECIFDIKAFLDFAEKEGFTEIVLQGHSLGCSKVAYYLAKTKDKRVKKLVLASPTDMVAYAQNWPHHKEMFSLAKKWVSEGKEKEILPKILNDSAYLSAATYIDFFTRGNPIDVFNLYDKDAQSKTMEEISVPTLAFFGSGKDSFFTKTPEETLKIIKSKAKNCPKFDIEVIKNAPHSYFGHEQEVADLIIDRVS